MKQKNFLIQFINICLIFTMLLIYSIVLVKVFTSCASTNVSQKNHQSNFIIEDSQISSSAIFTKLKKSNSTTHLGSDETKTSTDIFKDLGYSDSDIEIANSKYGSMIACADTIQILKQEINLENNVSPKLIQVIKFKQAKGLDVGMN